MCESSGTDDVPTQRSFGVWIADYDDGCYDDILALYNLERITVQPRIDERTNACVMEKLCLLGTEEFEGCSTAKCLEILKAAQGKAGVVPYSRSRGWAYWIKEKSRSKRCGNKKKKRGRKWFGAWQLW